MDGTIFMLAGFLLMFFLIKKLGEFIQGKRWEHKTCPFCGTDVSGKTNTLYRNGRPVLEYKCPNCKAYRAYDSYIWYRKKKDAKDEFDLDMRSE